MAGLDERIQMLEVFEIKNPLRKIDLSSIKNTTRWKEFEDLREEVIKKLRAADEMAKILAEEILAGMGVNGPAESSSITLVSDEEV